MTASGPSADVLRAFGAEASAASEPVRLPGGRGLTWRAGRTVLRPHDGPAVTDWRAGVLANLPPDAGFRTLRPVASRLGGWRAGEWEAWEWVPGTADGSRVEDVIRAGVAFHRAVAHVARPAFLAPPSSGSAVSSGPIGDPWALAGRMAWGELPVPRDPLLDRLAGAFRPVHAPSQLVHADLLGNVLFAPEEPPTIIDWPPSWRPAGFGEAVAAVDAVCWHGVPVDRLDGLGIVVADAGGTDDDRTWHQLLVRALAFRVATLHLLGARDADQSTRHGPVVDALV